LVFWVGRAKRFKSYAQKKKEEQRELGKTGGKSSGPADTKARVENTTLGEICCG